MRTELRLRHILQPDECSFETIVRHPNGQLAMRGDVLEQIMDVDAVGKMSNEQLRNDLEEFCCQDFTKVEVLRGLAQKVCWDGVFTPATCCMRDYLNQIGFPDRLKSSDL